MDCLVGQKASMLDAEVNALPFQLVDKFYGFGQNLLIKSRIYPVSEHQQFLSILKEFKKNYYFRELQLILNKDIMT